MKNSSLSHLIILFSLCVITACNSNQGNDSAQGDQMSDTQSDGMSDAGNMPGMDMSSMGGIQQDSGSIPDEIGQPRISEQGLFKVTASPQQGQVPLNTMHNWVVHVESASGQVIDDAEITVAGGMPAHMHGMPTAPEVTRSLGNGDYLVEGMQFQMPGHWVVNLDIDAAGQQDKVTVNFNLQP